MASLKGGKDLGKREGLLTLLTGVVTRDSPEHLQELKGLGVHLTNVSMKNVWRVYPSAAAASL